MHCRRVSGTALGGGTFNGLCKLLTGAGFEAAMSAAAEGDPAAVNLLVQDIFGANEMPFNLPPTATASFFAKVDPRTKPTAADVTAALVTMITQNIAQIVQLNASVQKLSRVFFTGSFLRLNDVAAHTIVTQMIRSVYVHEHHIFVFRLHFLPLCLCFDQ